MNERLKEVRKVLGLNQTEFGERIGVSAAAISKVERGKNDLTDQMIFDMCKEFGIDEQWLRTGEGEVFVITEDAIVQQFSDEYTFDELDKAISEAYLSLPEAHREAVKTFIQSVADTSSLPEILHTVRVFKAASKERPERSR